MYLGRLSSGFCKWYPLIPAAFSPCLPNPYPTFEVLVQDGVSEADVSCRTTVTWGPAKDAKDCSL